MPQINRQCQTAFAQNPEVLAAIHHELSQPFGVDFQVSRRLSTLLCDHYLASGFTKEQTLSAVCPILEQQMVTYRFFGIDVRMHLQCVFDRIQQQFHQEIEKLSMIQIIEGLTRGGIRM